MGIVYVVHLERPIEHMRHYVGFARDNDHLKERIAKHRSGDGAGLLKIANNAGIPWMVVRVWTGVPPEKERAVKSSSIKGVCPVCIFKELEIKKIKRAKTRAGVSV